MKTCLFVIMLFVIGCTDHYYAGPQGAKGDVGETGAEGPQGDKGDKGDPGVQGLQGIQGIVGPQGIQGIVGPQGVQGLIGPQGIQGVPGTPGTVVTFVKFCTQVTSYPSTFPEYGLCVAGNIFAIYSTNGGFGVELPQGSYSSNGINSACNFVVLPNCGISH